MFLMFESFLEILLLISGGKDVRKILQTVYKFFNGGLIRKLLKDIKSLLTAGAGLANSFFTSSYYKEFV